MTTTDPATGQTITNFNISGNHLPNAPNFSASAALEYRFDLGSGTLTPRIDGKYSSSYYFDVFNFVDTQQRGYATGNLSLTYAMNNPKIDISAFVRNFTDTWAFANAQRNFTGQPAINVYEFQAPRTFGGRIGYHL